MVARRARKEPDQVLKHERRLRQVASVGKDLIVAEPYLVVLLVRT